MDIPQRLTAPPGTGPLSPTKSHNNLLEVICQEKNEDKSLPYQNRVGLEPPYKKKETPAI